MTEGHTRRLQAILAADVVGYSRLMNRDEEGTLARLQALEREVVDPAIGGHGGEIVKRLGDGVLAVFPSAVDALRAARAIREQAVRVQGNETAQPIVYRIGLNVGDVIMAGNDIFGDGVNIASRLEGLADPGGIALSAAVHDNVRAQDPGPFDDLGERQVKNIDHPVRAYRIRFDDSPPLASPVGGSAGRWFAAGLGVLLVAVLLAWLLWPRAEPAAVVEQQAPATPAPVATVSPPPVAPVAGSGTSRPDPGSTARVPRQPGPITSTSGERPVSPQQPTTEATEPGFSERLFDSIAEAVEEELTGGGASSSAGPPGKNKAPPGQAKKEKRK